MNPTGNPIFDAIMANMQSGVIVPSQGMPNVKGDYRPQPGQALPPPVAPMGAAINQVGQMSNSPIITGGGEWAAMPNFGIGYD